MILSTLKEPQDRSFLCAHEDSFAVAFRSNSADLQVFSSLKGEDSGTLHEVGKLALTPTREGYCARWRWVSLSFLVYFLPRNLIFWKKSDL